MTKTRQQNFLAIYHDGKKSKVGKKQDSRLVKEVKEVNRDNKRSERERCFEPKFPFSFFDLSF